MMACRCPLILTGQLTLKWLLSHSPSALIVGYTIEREKKNMQLSGVQVSRQKTSGRTKLMKGIMQANVIMGFSAIMVIHQCEFDFQGINS